MRSKVLVITKGLPASGKSTWAKQQVLDSEGTMKRVNKDSIRAMLGAKHSRANEKIVVATRDAAVTAALQAGFSVVVDDTNFAKAHVDALRKLAEDNGAVFSINDSFLEVPLEVCIERDLRRLESVGRDVIYTMYINYVAKPYLQSEGWDIPDCILVDLDGTLALFDGNPYERVWAKDICNPAVRAAMFGATTTGHIVIIMSGRSDAYRVETEAWLAANEVTYSKMFMRKAGDVRKDTIVKREIFDREIRDKYKVSFVIDDRPSVVRMWRHELGLTVFQVAPDIEF